MKYLIMLALLLGQSVSFAKSKEKSKKVTKQEYKFKSRDYLRLSFLGVGFVSLGAGTVTSAKSKVDQDFSSALTVGGLSSTLIGIVESGTSQNLYKQKFYEDFRTVKYLVRSSNKLNIVLVRGELADFLKKVELSHNSELEKIKFLDELIQKISARAKKDLEKESWKDRFIVAKKANEILNSLELNSFLYETLGSELTDKNLEVAYKFYMVEFYDAFKVKYKRAFGIR